MANDQIRSWWTEACRSGSCQNCKRMDDNGDVLAIEIPNVFNLRLCLLCAQQLMRELQLNGIKPFRATELKR